MERQQIQPLCEQFKSLLRDRFSKNHRQQRFLPHGTAQEVFRNHKPKLKELLLYVSRALLEDDELLERVASRILESLSNVLAIVLMDRTPNGTDALNLFLGLILDGNHHMKETLGLTDSELPICKARAETLFLDRGRNFYTRQLQFCAIVLQEETEVECLNDEQDLCPLPYLEQTLIGAGAFGQVFKVKIESHHMRSANGNSENRDPVLLARKDFQLQKAFEKELEVLRKIMRQPERHGRLVPLLAILQHEATYSLFFPLAACDLDTYLKSERHPPVPGSLDEKALYHRGVALAGALAFLHGGFSDMSFYHLDLKPRNILVFDADTPHELWKITDFGLSRVRVKANSPNDGDSTMTIGVEGTYLAPECAVPGGKVSALSDVWSFGCILSLVLTFMTDGRNGINEFSCRRSEQPNGDCFYTNPTTPKISPAVTAWFDHLKGSTSRDLCSNVMSESLDFLLRSVLLPEKKGRMPASGVEARLKKIWTSCSRPGPLPTPKERRYADSTPSRWHRLLSGANRNTGPTPPLEFKSAARGSRFSPGGEILVSFTSRLNWILELSGTSRNAVVEVPGSANCLSVSDKYICNGLDGSCFKCCVYTFRGALDTIESPEPPCISLPALGSIKMATLSKDDSLAAFIITQKPGGTEMDCLRYICKTKDLIRAAGDGGYPSPISSRSNSAVSAPSLGSMTTRSTISRLGPIIGSATDIRFFGFTGDGQFLVMVTQVETSSFGVKAWRTESDTLYQEMSIPHMGSSATTAAHFTACTVFVLDNILHLFILSQEQYLINVDLTRKTSKNGELKGQMVYIHHSNDTKTLIFLKHDRRHIFALPVPAVLSAAEAHIFRPTQIGKIKSSPTRNGQPSIAMRNKGSGGAEVLLATAEGDFYAAGVTIPTERAGIISRDSQR